MKYILKDGRVWVYENENLIAKEYITYSEMNFRRNPVKNLVLDTRIIRKGYSSYQLIDRETGEVIDSDYNFQ